MLSCLHRRGVAAALTLGNKKGVDILVAPARGIAATVEVKGVAKKYDWPAASLQGETNARHFVALVCFNGEISNKEMPSPDVWIIPHAKIRTFLREYGGDRINISRANMIKKGSEYVNAWHLIEGSQA